MKAKKLQNYWNRETCFEEAKKFKSRSEFSRSSSGAYEKARINKWLDDYTWFEQLLTKPAGYWNYERCATEARKYKRKIEFSKGSPGAYQAAYKNGWINDYTWFRKKYQRKA